jgi:peptidoglycan-associated lipoprotein
MRRVALLGSLLLCLFLTGCPKKNNKDTSNKTPEPTKPTGTSEVPEVRAGLPAASDGALLSRIFFEFDSTTLTPESREELRVIAERMRSDASMRLSLEGHADERGSTQYNLALSDRRAAAVSRFFTDLGISSAAMKSVGFGEERPLVNGQDESSWAKNRRVDVVGSRSEDRVAGSAP